jgi:hypothetical protein
MKADVLSNMVEIVDAVFSITAEETAVRENISLKDAREGMWALFEAGFIRLVNHSDGTGVEPCLSRNERRAAAKKNKLLANYRRRIGEGTLWVEQVESDDRIAEKTVHIVQCLVERLDDGDAFIETGVTANVSLPGYSDRAVRVAMEELVQCGHLTFDDDSQRFRSQLRSELTDGEGAEAATVVWVAGIDARAAEAGKAGVEGKRRQ